MVIKSPSVTTKTNFSRHKKRLAVLLDRWFLRLTNRGTSSSSKWSVQIMESSSFNQETNTIQSPSAGHGAVFLSIPDSSLFKRSDFIDASNAKCLVLTFVLFDCSISPPPRCFTHLSVCAFLSFLRGCLLICLFKSVCACSVTNGYWNNKNASHIGRKKKKEKNSSWG